MPNFQRFVAALLFCGLSSAALANDCYVIGDNSKNNLSRPLGSKTNPYGSLAAVESNAGCGTIVVLYSAAVLDGGISLQTGQEIKGKKGPAGALPIISNTSGATNGGHGVQLASDNSITNISITDTYNSGVNGGNVGKLAIQNSSITRFGLSENLTPSPPPIDYFVSTPPGIAIEASANMKVRISQTELGESNSASINIAVLAGHADIIIEDVAVRDQGAAGSTITPGISVTGFGHSSTDLKIQDTSVSNIGAGACNCDGLILGVLEGSAMELLVDGYSYDNPDGDGTSATAGIELVNFFGTGTSLKATIKNSVIRDAPTTGIQVFSQAPGDSSIVDVHIHDNEIYDVGRYGIAFEIGFGAQNGTYTVTIENNLIANPGVFGIEYFSAIEQQTLVNMLIQKNTVLNALVGLYFEQGGGASAAVLNLDAGLGGLGSQGKNRIIGSQLADIYALTFDCCGLPVTPPFVVEAANNWWGSSAGPASVIELGAATVDAAAFLTEDPED